MIGLMPTSITWFQLHLGLSSGGCFITFEKRNKAQAIEPTATELDKLPLINSPLHWALFPSPRPSRERAVQGATIAGGLLNGTSRSVVTEFTLYLGILLCSELKPKIL